MSEAFAGFRLTEIGDIPVLWLLDRRFKTFRFALHFRRPLDERAAARSLLPALLLQGTERDPDRPALARRMEQLYGAGVVPSTGKLGESHMLRLVLDAVAGDYLPDRPDQLGEGLALLADYVARPRLEAGGFPSDAFERERTQAEHAVRAVFNDKGSYAAQQALAAACAGEPMAIPEHGGLEALAALGRDAPEAARQDFLRRGACWAVAHGALPEESLLESIGALLDALPPRASEPVGEPVIPAPRPRRALVERVAVQQSKQVLVFRVPWAVDARTWVARVLFVNMLGGGPHSRLFREVREKQSLAYYAQAVLERHKGLMQVHTGLDEAAAESVEAEVLRQLDELRAGRFEPHELDTAKAVVASALASLSDGIWNRMEYTSRQWVLGQDRTPEQQAALYASVTAEEVACSMDGAWLDFSYLLAPEEAR